MKHPSPVNKWYSSLLLLILFLPFSTLSFAQTSEFPDSGVMTTVTLDSKLLVNYGGHLTFRFSGGGDSQMHLWLTANKELTLSSEGSYIRRRLLGSEVVYQIAVNSAGFQSVEVYNPEWIDWENSHLKVGLQVHPLRHKRPNVDVGEKVVSLNASSLHPPSSVQWGVPGIMEYGTSQSSQKGGVSLPSGDRRSESPDLFGGKYTVPAYTPPKKDKDKDDDDRRDRGDEDKEGKDEPVAASSDDIEELLKRLLAILMSLLQHQQHISVLAGQLHLVFEEQPTWLALFAQMNSIPLPESYSAESWSAVLTWLHNQAGQNEVATSFLSAVPSQELITVGGALASAEMYVEAGSEDHGGMLEPSLESFSVLLFNQFPQAPEFLTNFMLDNGIDTPDIYSSATWLNLLNWLHQNEQGSQFVGQVPSEHKKAFSFAQRMIQNLQDWWRAPETDI